MLSTNQKIRLQYHYITPWIQTSISKTFSVGGGWGLGWANDECIPYIDALKSGLAVFDYIGALGVIEQTQLI